MCGAIGAWVTGVLVGGNWSTIECIFRYDSHCVTDLHEPTQDLDNLMCCRRHNK